MRFINFSLIIGLLLILGDLQAGSRQGHGIIVSVDDNGEDPPKIEIEGVFASHFSGQRYLPWQHQLTLVATGEKTGTYIYIVDGLIVPDSIGRRALLPGRRIAFTEDVIAIATSEEISDVGILKSFSDDALVLTKMENAELGYGRPVGFKDITFSLDEDTDFIMNAQVSSRSEVMVPGAYVRRIGAVAQTINVTEAVTPIRAFPGAYVNSRVGTITGYDPDTRTVKAMMQLADGNVIEQEVIARKHVSLDSHFLPRTEDSYFRFHAAFEPGRRVFFFAHRNSVDPNEVYIQSRRPGEVQGRLVEVSDSTLAIEVWGQGKLQTVNVQVEANARVRWNYRDASRAEAFKLGSWIHIMPSHGMQVVAGRWDEPILGRSDSTTICYRIDRNRQYTG